MLVRVFVVREKFSSLNMHIFVHNDIDDVGLCFCDSGELFVPKNLYVCA